MTGPAWAFFQGFLRLSSEGLNNSRTERLYRTPIEKLILWHLWACAPFALPWLLFPDVFGRAQQAPETAAMRTLFAAIGASLVLRTWILLKGVKGPWPFVWPLVDVGFITIGAKVGYAQPDSWVILLYVLPVLQAAAFLDVRWSIAVATIGALACGMVSEGGLSNLQYSYFLFRLALLILVASLVTRLARGLVRARSRLELAQYRSDLAAEMHDGLQQYLGAIAMRLEVAERVAPRNPEEAAKTAVSVKEIARQASDELRLMLHRLRSPLLERGTLEDALRFQAALFGERSAIPVEVKIEGVSQRLTPKQEHALLRIAQEALTNIAKHSGAASSEVCLRYDDDGIVLVVSDDGTGFDPNAKKDGLGMETIRNRAESAGGTVEIHKAEPHGTIIEVKVPVAPV